MSGIVIEVESFDFTIGLSRKIIMVYMKILLKVVDHVPVIQVVPTLFNVIYTQVNVNVEKV